jgi:cytochrome c553
VAAHALHNPAAFARQAALLGLAILMLASSAASSATPTVERIYRDGVLPSGQPLRARQHGVPLIGRDAACVNCHRRSGFGMDEGSVHVGALARRVGPAGSDAITADGAGNTLRENSAYTPAALALALREGIAANGRELDPLMPRYCLSDAEIASLHAYLSTLSAEPAPGVTDDAIHFATILAPGIDTGRSDAMLRTLRAFFSDKNGESRQETRRRQIGREQMYRAHRTWVLHPWKLHGPPHAWGSQLAALYRQQPVFAVIGGLGADTWQGVHAFCERFETPCVFPDVDDPDASGTGHYVLYFSRGLRLEADALAKYLAESGATVLPGSIVQVYRDRGVGRVPAQALRAALKGRGTRALIDRPLRGDEALSSVWRASRPASEYPMTVLLWLEANELRPPGTPPAGIDHVYVSASLASTQPSAFPPSWLAKLRMVSPFDLPDSRRQRLARMRAWLRVRQIPLTDERTQAHAFFAASITGEAIAHLGENFSRDYFIERIEQMLESFLAPSMYPHLSLGPGQRFASRGAYLLRFPSADAAPVLVSDWLVP